jgi:hypothetical protein
MTVDLFIQNAFTEDVLYFHYLFICCRHGFNFPLLLKLDAYNHGTIKMFQCESKYLETFPYHLHLYSLRSRLRFLKNDPF